MENGALSIFSMDNFQKGVKSTEYHNAPAGFLWPGDPGFPKGKTGLYPAVVEPVAAHRRRVGCHG